VLETRMNVYWRKLIKSNREGRRRIQLIVKGFNHSKAEIEKEQPEFQEVLELYGEDAYSQQGTNPITVMETIIKMEEILASLAFSFSKRICIAKSKQVTYITY
jgi:hypothetical protein